MHLPEGVAEISEVANRPTPRPHKRWSDRLLERIQARNGVWLVAGLALALALPAMRFGLQTDDHIASAVVAAREFRNPFIAFGFEPSPGLDRSSGYLSWWSSPQLRVRFMRPLSALSHADLYLGPGAAWLMHGVNALLYAALSFVAFLLYRELLPTLPRLAAGAGILFAIDEGHAPAVGWISSRNTLLYALFVLSGLLMHQRRRALERAGSSARKQLIASVVLTALAFLSGEGAVAIVAYLIAYELAFERGDLRQRSARLWPLLSVIAAWAVAYVAGGYGVRGSSFYRELTDPIGTVLAGLADLPFWLLGLLGLSAIGAANLGPAVAGRVIASVLCLLLLAAWSVLPRTRENRFFVLGAVLCLPPLFTTIPQDRVLILASFGAFGALASFISAAAQSTRRYVRGVGWVMLAVHAVFAPLLFIPMLNQAGPIEAGSQAVVRAIPDRSPPQIILVNTPVELITVYAHSILREHPERTPPEALQQLYTGGSSLTVTRIDANTLELSASKGWGAMLFERIFGRVENMPRAGETLKLDRLVVAVQESDAEGHPTRVQFRFPSPLESPERLFYVWRGQKPSLWQPPAIGAREQLAPLSFMSSLGR